MLNKVLNIIDATSNWTGKIFAPLLWLGMAVILAEVVLRNFFNAPTIWAYPVGQRIFAVYFIIGGAYGVLTKAHISIDFLYKRFPPKVQAFIDIGLHPLFLCIVAVAFMWYGSALAALSLRTLEYEPPLGAPIYPFKLLIPVAGFFLLLQGLVQGIRNYMAWRHHEP